MVMKVGAAVLHQPPNLALSPSFPTSQCFGKLQKKAAAPADTKAPAETPAQARVEVDVLPCCRALHT